MRKQLLTAALLTVTTFPVMAENFYLVTDVGQSKLDIDVEDYSATKTETVISLGGGYQFNKVLALEVAYRDLGDFSESANDDLGGGDYIMSSSETGINVFQASLVAQLPLNETAAFYGRLGVGSLKAKSDYEIEAVLNGNESSVSGSESERKTKAVFGVGFKYALNQDFALRAEYSQYAELNALTISTTTVGLTYAF